MCCCNATSGCSPWFETRAYVSSSLDDLIASVLLRFRVQCSASHEDACAPLPMADLLATNDRTPVTCIGQPAYGSNVGRRNSEFPQPLPVITWKEVSAICKSPCKLRHSLQTKQPYHCTERRGQVVNTPPSYPGRPQFKSGLGDRLSVIFPRPYS
jgi:hypothetical protein